MKNFKNKLRNRLKEIGMRQNVLAQQLGLSNAQIHHFLSGIRTPDLKTLLKIEEILGLSPGWLIYDHDGIKKEAVSLRSAPILSLNQVHNWLEHDTLDPGVEYINILNLNNNKDIKMNENSYVIRVVGDAMVSPDNTRRSLYDGDYAIVDPGALPTNGSLVVAQISDDDVKIRKFVVDGSQKFLQSYDPHFPIIRLDDGVKLLGVIRQSFTSHDYSPQ